jgi:hypothetical protein
MWVDRHMQTCDRLTVSAIKMALRLGIVQIDRNRER